MQVGNAAGGNWPQSREKISTPKAISAKEYTVSVGAGLDKSSQFPPTRFLQNSSLLSLLELP